jgi:hypothetical protein
MVALATLFECVAERAREFDVIHCHLQQSTRAAAEVDTIYQGLPPALNAVLRHGAWPRPTAIVSMALSPRLIAAPCVPAHGRG